MHRQVNGEVRRSHGKRNTFLQGKRRRRSWKASISVDVVFFQPFFEGSQRLVNRRRGQGKISVEPHQIITWRSVLVLNSAMSLRIWLARSHLFLPCFLFLAVSRFT